MLANVGRKQGGELSWLDNEFVPVHRGLWRTMVGVGRGKGKEVWSISDKGFEDAKLVIEALKNKGVSTIGAAGFCWGGKIVAELARCDYIKAAVMLHPAFVTVDDIKEVKCHIAILGAEIDKSSPPELLKQFEEILSLKSEVDSYVKIFPGVVHGWTTRYDTGDETAVKKAEEAHQDMLEWFAKHLS
ncbi:putative endo-1,3-1,4-beta-D-glucanase [Cocos nucifera]|uniref:Putative endo-1,3-1,4-beta-D-glucanase n=1 Tax=Cocos nucifera TaxID=13894 RepID=A0A8K0NDS6_COCNU|nr:putative endo-1,3-1,4-beta-D-glucanase [Cocos nucifera]